MKDALGVPLVPGDKVVFARNEYGTGVVLSCGEVTKIGPHSVNVVISNTGKESRDAVGFVINCRYPRRIMKIESTLDCT